MLDNQVVRVGRGQRAGGELDLVCHGRGCGQLDAREGGDTTHEVRGGQTLAQHCARAGRNRDSGCAGVGGGDQVAVLVIQADHRLNGKQFTGLGLVERQVEGSRLSRDAQLSCIAWIDRECVRGHSAGISAQLEAQTVAIGRSGLVCQVREGDHT